MGTQKPTVLRQRRNRTAGILVGAAFVFAVTWFRLALAPIAGSDMALIFYILVVLLAARIGGAVSGITTTVLSLLAGIAFIVGPQSLFTSVLEWLRVVVFLIEGVAISLTVDHLKSQALVLHKTALELQSEKRLVERMAFEDVMTGLGNRRAFERDLEQSLAQASQDGTGLTLVIADIDGLKCLNDEQGHSQGDALLVALAAALRECCRASDTAYRLGGDEFALLLPETDREAYGPLKTRLSTAVVQAARKFHTTGVSFGAAHAPQDGEKAGELCRLADSRMYDSKSNHQTSPANRYAGAKLGRSRNVRF